MPDENKIPDSLLKELELDLKLEYIFMPYASRQRDEAYKRQSGSIDTNASGSQFVCAHYTSAEAALKIINSKRVWMRNTTCMSDYREVQHGFDILHSFFSNKDKEALFLSSLEPFAPGAAQDAFIFFNQWWANIQNSTYITSMSEHDSSENLHGRLSMWRAFGGNSARVAIIFKLPWFTQGARALKLMFSPVTYLTKDEAHLEILKVIENIRNSADFLRQVDRQKIVNCVFNMLVLGVTCLKHEGFKEEREWRAIYGPHRNPSNLIESSTEIVSGIPQLIYKLPLDSNVDSILSDIDFTQLFERIIIGPSSYPRVMHEAFVEALKKIGVPEPEKRVFISNIPIRS